MACNATGWVALSTWFECVKYADTAFSLLHVHSSHCGFMKCYSTILQSFKVIERQDLWLHRAELAWIVQQGHLKWTFKDHPVVNTNMILFENCGVWMRNDQVNYITMFISDSRSVKWLSHLPVGYYTGWVWAATYTKTNIKFTNWLLQQRFLFIFLKLLTAVAHWCAAACVLSLCLQCNYPCPPGCLSLACLIATPQLNSISTGAPLTGPSALNTPSTASSLQPR